MSNVKILTSFTNFKDENVNGYRAECIVRSSRGSICRMMMLSCVLIKGFDIFICLSNQQEPFTRGGQMCLAKEMLG